ncbi:Uncharacterised protein [Vibrio cholerae]|nr:Uncharacterised protein [Vibrio cholerae]CSC83557.1 Uncharacterised protein [Vibrio cholerae]CSD38736.1 Uncharacterised protein [Vibrio cholerae]
MVGHQCHGRDPFVGAEILRGVPGFKGFQMGFEFLTIRTGMQLVLLNMVVAEDG